MDPQGGRATERKIDRGLDVLPNGRMVFDVPAEGFHRSIGSQEPIGQRFIFTQQAQQQMLLSMYGEPNWLASQRRRRPRGGCSL